jgi:type II secretory pathway pseudopilin PulG
VVVSIIALLVGILLPAIGKARDQANLTKSQSNLKQLGTANVTYAAEYNDRQVTFIDDSFARYGTDGPTAVSNYATATGYEHPAMILGYGQGGIWGFFMPPTGPAGNYVTIVPMDFASKFGAFRIPNARQFNQYLNGRFYDPILYAPKDSAVMASVEPWFDHPDEYVPGSVTNGQKWSSYCWSPAAMFNPAVFGLNTTTQRYFTDPYALPSGFKSPSYSQARFPDLKTHMLEHHWLQARKKVCNPAFTGGTYDGCEPMYFNHSWESAPVTLFFDGHIESLGQKDAIDANSRICAQNGQQSQSGNAYKGLWSVDSPLAGSYQDYGTGGYYMNLGLDWSSTSHHILTIDGIRGRDVIAK